MKRKIIAALTMTFAVATVFVSGPLIMITDATGKDNGDNYEESIYANSAEVIAAEGCQETFEIDWGGMVDEFTAAILGSNGGAVDVVTGDRIVVPDDVLRFMAGSNACLALHARPGLGFSVSGRDLDNTAETLSVTVSSSGISEAAKQMVMTDALAYCQFDLEGKEALPFRMNVHMLFGQQYADKAALFYSCDEPGGPLKLIGAAGTNQLGQAVFGLSRGGSYLAVVVDRDYVVKSGDTLSHIANRFGITVGTLRALNPQIADADMIQPGETIRLF